MGSDFRSSLIFIRKRAQKDVGKAGCVFRDECVCIGVDVCMCVGEWTCVCVFNGGSGNVADSRRPTYSVHPGVSTR